MSQFNFPRINFHGSVSLDVPTANNGRFEPLRVYNQDEAAPYLPPRVYLDKVQAEYVDQHFNNLKVIKESQKEEYFVEIEPVNTADLYIDWALYSLGTSPLDKDYYGLYDYVTLAGTDTKLSDGWIQPGYWNYYGDLGVKTNDIRIVGVQLPDSSGGVNTWSSGNTVNCPEILASLLGSSLSFDQEFFYPDSPTTSRLCDVDSIGQTCTQMFFGKAGIYSKAGGIEKTFFTGRPCKSTFNWMSFNKVLNWSDPMLNPMGGSAYFYSTIQLDHCDPKLQQLFDAYAGEKVTALFMKILVHEVYEVHNPDYTKMPYKPGTQIKKNPAQVSFSGSICPWVEGDMMTNTICRILKNPSGTPIAIDTSNMVAPTPMGADGPLSIPTEVNLPPAFVKFNGETNLISLDVINTILEYGVGFKEFPAWSGKTAVQPFESFENYDFGTLTLKFTPFGSSVPSIIGTFDFQNDYNMDRFLARGGVIDFPVPPNSAFGSGLFSIDQNNKPILIEDRYLFITDQQGTYAEQNQDPSYLYMSDGLPRVPISIRAFDRGIPILENHNFFGFYQTIQITTNSISLPQKIQIYDGMNFNCPVSEAGCFAYAFSVDSSQQLQQKPTMEELFYFLTNGYFITNRVLAYYPKLVPYLNGQEPITFQVIYDHVLSNYHTVLPIMNAILPFTEATWESPIVRAKLQELIKEENWGDSMYMPVTRELSAQQRQLLHKWAEQ